jgi:Txe/YoeB family toxin of toxin-antitoxin system
VIPRPVLYDPEILDDLLWWQQHDPETGARVVELIELAIHAPKTGRGRPKKLGALPGVWSRRISHTHRLFYVVEPADGHEIGALRFVSCRGHDVPERLREELRESA